MKKTTLHFVVTYILLQWGASSLLAACAGSFLPFMPDEEVPKYYHTSPVIRDMLGFTQIPVAISHLEDPRRALFYKHACEVLDTEGEEAMAKEFTTIHPHIESYKILFEKIKAGTVKMQTAHIEQARSYVIPLVKTLWILSEKGYKPASDIIFKIFDEGIYGMPEDGAVSAALCHRPSTSTALRAKWKSWQEQERIVEASRAKYAEERRSSGETITDEEPEDRGVRKFSAYESIAAESRAPLLDGFHKKAV